MHHFSSSLAATANIINLPSHFLQSIKHRHAAITQSPRHVLPIDTQLCKRIACLLGHQPDISDAHRYRLHVLVGEQSTLRVLNDSHQLICTHSCVAEGRSVLLDHAEQLTTVTGNHSLHSVLQQTECLFATHTELLNERVGGIHSLTEVHIVCPHQCPDADSQILRFRPIQSCCHRGHILLTVQLIVIIHPRFCRSHHRGNASGHGGCCCQGAVRHHAHQLRVDSQLTAKTSQHRVKVHGFASHLVCSIPHV